MNLKKSVLAVLLLAGLTGGYLLFHQPLPPAPTAPTLPLLTIPAGIPGAAQPARATVVAALTERLVNPLERSADLRADYERYKNSADPSERNTAYRAWSACFPTFVAPHGQAVSLEGVARAMAPDDPDNAQRIDAYRTLMGRCKNFSDMSREQIVHETERQKSAWSSGAALAPGELAAKLLTDGDAERARQSARAVIASRDPAAIRSLHEFINHYLVLQVDAQAQASDTRPDLRSLAFSMAACQMGLECGPASLTAVQQCANIGACSGGVVERYLASVPNRADRERLTQESAQVADAIRAGNFHALGL